MNKGNGRAKRHLWWLFVSAAAWAPGRGTARAAAASRGFEGRSRAAPSSSPSSFDPEPTRASRRRRLAPARRHSEAEARASLARDPPTAASGALLARAGSSPPPAKARYTAAAAAAVKTIDALASRTRRGGRAADLLPDLLSESALMDKETNAVYWQGGAKIFSTSLVRPYLAEKFGIVHLKATVLAIALWLWAWGRASRYLVARLFGPPAGEDAGGPKLLFALPFVAPDRAPPFLRRAASLAAPFVQFLLLVFKSLLHVRLPPYPPRILAATIVLYLLEAYGCSSRRYLSHAMDAPAAVEAYLEGLRGAAPVVTWKVRCFHYEERALWNGCRGVGRALEGWMARRGEGGDGGDGGGGDGSGGRGQRSFARARPGAAAMSSASESFVESPSPWMARKVITHQAKGSYSFGR